MYIFLYFNNELIPSCYKTRVQELSADCHDEQPIIFQSFDSRLKFSLIMIKFEIDSMPRTMT